jgi:hypothetical protein
VNGYLFLDIDGVLNSDESRKAGRTGSMSSLDPNACRRLSQAQLGSRFHVVIHSSRRSHTTLHDFRRALDRHSISVFDVVPADPADKVLAIRTWLRAHPDVVQYMVVDDERGVTDAFGSDGVEIDPRVGITSAQARLIAGELGGEG